MSEAVALQKRLSKPIYGAPGGIKSLNFKNWAWVHTDKDGKVKDPYKLLPPVFADADLDNIETIFTGDSVADGGAAMTAYARMQFTEMSDLERDQIVKALLKYCELDTFAMVLIYEYWKNEIETSIQTAA